MKLPLQVLSVLAVLGGLLNLPIHPIDFLSRWLAPVFGSNLLPAASNGREWLFGIFDAVLAIAGVSVAYTLWRSVSDHPAAEPTFLQRAWMIDYSYDRVFAQGGTRAAVFLATVVDNKIIDGAVNGTASLVRGLGSKLRLTETGYVRNYALGIVGGLVVVLAFLLVRAH
jgi:NADH-quinone oxidoreductase subunit L